MTKKRLVPIAKLSQERYKVLAELSEEEVILTEDDQAVAVLVDINEWKRLEQEREDFQDSIDAMEARRHGRPTIGLNEYLKRRGGRHHVSYRDK